MQFLCIVPKHQRASSPDEGLIYSNVKRVMESVDRAYGPYLSDAYEAPVLARASANSTAFLAVWNRTDDVSKGSFCSAGDKWVAAAGQHVAKSIHRDVVLAGGSLRYTRPVWGSYAVVLGERYTDRITAWCTAPALEAIHYGQSSEYVFISNRPIVAALALSYGNLNTDSLSDVYLSEYLAYGYSVSGQTPFLGISTSPVNSAVSVVKGRLHLEPAPKGLESGLAPDHSLDEGAEALSCALTNAMDRTEEDIQGSNLQVRLSGGKDSRLMLGLLRGRKINADAITYGVETDAEVTIAAKVASMANIPHRVASPGLSEGSDVSEQTLRTILECGGIPPSEPHLARNIGSNPAKLNDAIMLGQWPLFKGGMAKIVRYPKNGIDKSLRSQISPLVGDDVRGLHEGALRNWSDNVHASSELEKLYLYAREFRSGRYLHSHISHYSRDAQIAYPISDSEVTAISDDLSMFEKVSQKTLFLAMRNIWPESLAVPLHNSIWRFEASGPSEISGEDYTQRMTQPDLVRVKASPTRDGSAPGALDSKTINGLCREIVSSSLWETLCLMIANPMSEAISASAEVSSGWQFSSAGLDYSTKEFSKYVWRIYVAAKWRSGDWLTESK